MNGGKKRRKPRKMEPVGMAEDFGWDDTPMRGGSSHSDSRKAASAMIAKIPGELSRYIARYYRP